MSQNVENTNTYKYRNVSEVERIRRMSDVVEDTSFISTNIGENKNLATTSIVSTASDTSSQPKKAGNIFRQRPVPKQPTKEEAHELFVEKIKSLQPVVQLDLPYGMTVSGNGKIIIPERKLYTSRDRPMIAVESELFQIARSVVTYNFLLKIRDIFLSHSCVPVHDFNVTVYRYRNSDRYEYDDHHVDVPPYNKYLLSRNNDFMENLHSLNSVRWFHSHNVISFPIPTGQAYAVSIVRQRTGGSSGKGTKYHQYLTHTLTRYVGLPASPPYLGYAKDTTSTQYQLSSQVSSVVNSSFYKKYTQRRIMPVEGCIDGVDILSTVGETLPPDGMWEALIAGLDNDREATKVLAHLTIPSLKKI